MENKSCIELIHLTKQFLNPSLGPCLVLTDLSVSFHQGQTYAITGISGSGKSTLLFLLAGIDVPSSGSVVYDGVDLHNLSQETRVRFLKNRIGIVFQKPHLIKELSVLENVMLKVLDDQFDPKDKIRALELLKAVGLEDKALLPPAILSGGQQQRVAIARALFNRPHFLIADEPTAHLDAENKRLILELIVKLSKDFFIGLILSTHDQEVANHMEHVFELKNGMLIT